ncbi:hypothetical protein N8I84_42085 (plasmid) [Streptomyces cynarae]|uniref:Uncharacterized protein n=1 Tax=Streptomyces cynarae TaxID=2981134 RepID=A0ABY6EEL7_9ACTN|nr:hypothetical protein [Streptomyces cynarae]UXY25019.1 hypothetical protein N8I84_42085 [Streptomyces cynarae]
MTAHAPGRCALVKTMKEAFEDARLEEGVYCLCLTGDEARATLRALADVPADDLDAAAAHARLHRLVEPQPRLPRRTDEEEREAKQRLAPPYDLPDAEALQGFAAPTRRRRRQG